MDPSLAWIVTWSRETFSSLGFCSANASVDVVSLNWESVVRTSVACAGVTVAGPGGEHEQQPRVAASADLVALARREDEERAGSARGGRAVGAHLDLAVH